MEIGGDDHGDPRRATFRFETDCRLKPNLGSIPVADSASRYVSENGCALALGRERRA